MQGPLHAKYIRNLPEIYKRQGLDDLSEFVSKNIELLAEAVQSPDSDHPEMKIPDNFLPANLKASNTSLVKWEHTIPLDMPSDLTELLKNLVENTLKMPFKYADDTFIDWYGEAVSLIGKDPAKSLWHLGRSCHLAQDVCVPMHVAVSSGFSDLYHVLMKLEPSHDTFEKYCDTVFKWDFNTKPAFLKVDKEFLQALARSSKGMLKYCDGMSVPAWASKFMPVFMYKLLQKLINDDYNKAALYTNESAQSVTASIVYDYYIVLMKK